MYIQLLKGSYLILLSDACMFIKFLNKFNVNSSMFIFSIYEGFNAAALFRIYSHHSICIVKPIYIWRSDHACPIPPILTWILWVLHIVWACSTCLSLAFEMCAGHQNLNYRRLCDSDYIHSFLHLTHAQLPNFTVFNQACNWACANPIPCEQITWEMLVCMAFYMHVFISLQISKLSKYVLSYKTSKQNRYYFYNGLRPMMLLKSLYMSF